MAKKMLQTVRNAGLAGLFYSTFYSAKLLQAFVFACLAGVSYSIFYSRKMLCVAFSGMLEGVLSLLAHLWREGQVGGKVVPFLGELVFYLLLHFYFRKRCNIFGLFFRVVRKRCNRTCTAALEICVT